MGTGQPLDIPFPFSSFPGANPQESAGRLINAYTEPLGDPQQGNRGAPLNGVLYRRAPGLTQFSQTGQTGYRGGLEVAGVSYEIFSGQAVTVTSAGVSTLLGPLAGTDSVSLACNQNATAQDVVVVDPVNGAFVLASSTIAGPYPKAYNGGGNLPAPNSVSFQDGYFFFTIGDGRVFASAINTLTQNALTFARIEAKADVTLLRGVAFSGYMFFFTTGSLEVWNDQANPAPAFPYGRNAILTHGLIQSSAIAGFETGFDNLLWVSQDFGVYNLPPGSITPTPVSTPDVNRMIETQIRAGDTLTAGVFIFAGKKIWSLTSAKWTWNYNLTTGQWFERSSLQSNGLQGQWRGIGGHPAFGKWLMGDQQSSALVYIDDTNYADTLIQDPTTFQTIKTHMTMRLESGMVDKFPVRSRVARADFHFVRGVGSPVGITQLTVTGAVSGTGGVIRLTVTSTLGCNTGDQVLVSGVLGVQANGVWTSTIVDATHLELAGSVFTGTYEGGGMVTNMSIQPDLTDPTLAISWSDDGGLSYRPPVLRHLGQMSVVKTGRVAVKNTGLTGVIGRRWRLDVTAPVYTAFLRGTQSDSMTIPN